VRDRNRARRVRTDHFVIAFGQQILRRQQQLLHRPLMPRLSNTGCRSVRRLEQREVLHVASADLHDGPRSRRPSRVPSRPSPLRAWLTAGGRSGRSADRVVGSRGSHCSGRSDADRSYEARALRRKSLARGAGLARSPTEPRVTRRTARRALPALRRNVSHRGDGRDGTRLGRRDRGHLCRSALAHAELLAAQGRRTLRQAGVLKRASARRCRSCWLSAEVICLPKAITT